MRLFVALHPDAKTQAWLATVQKRLRGELARFERDLKWANPASIHLTLAFLGELPGAEPVADALETCRGEPMDLAVGGLGAFPSPRHPAVLWTGVADPTGALARFHEKVVTAMTPFVPPERRPFAAHLTLARIPRDGPRIGEAITELAERAANLSTPWRVTHFRLMRSELGRTGASHSVVREFRLGDTIPGAQRKTTPRFLDGNGPLGTF